jgi:hypothetical protein
MQRQNLLQKANQATLLRSAFSILVGLVDRSLNRYAYKGYVIDSLSKGSATVQGYLLTRANELCRRPLEVAYIHQNLVDQFYNIKALKEQETANIDRPLDFLPTYIAPSICATFGEDASYLITGVVQEAR